MAICCEPCRARVWELPFMVYVLASASIHFSPSGEPCCGRVGKAGEAAPTPAAEVGAFATTRSPKGGARATIARQSR